VQRGKSLRGRGNRRGKAQEKPSTGPTPPIEFVIASKEKCEHGRSLPEFLEFCAGPGGSKESQSKRKSPNSAPPELACQDETFCK
jgi:hypothetical protein